MNNQVTIRDIALKLDISTSTVSRALRGVPDISPKTKQAVLDMAEELHYEPNVIAQSLRSNKTNIIGVVVPEIAIHFFSSVISGIQDKASEYGYNIMICQSNENQQTELTNLKALVSSRVDGILICLSRESTDFRYLHQLHQQEIPMVLFDRVCEELPVSQVIVDDRHGAFQAIAHLFANGYRRIAHLAGPSSLNISRGRLQGYLEALDTFNMKRLPELIVECPHMKDSATAATHQLLDLPHPPDAIFAINDPVAINAAEVIEKRGVNIPDQIGLVGFTDEPVGQHMTPALTTVAQPSYEIGQVAMELFLEQVNIPGKFKPRKKILNTKLVVRGSSRKTPQPQ